MFLSPSCSLPPSLPLFILFLCLPIPRPPPPSPQLCPSLYPHPIGVPRHFFSTPTTSMCVSLRLCIRLAPWSISLLQCLRSWLHLEQFLLSSSNLLFFSLSLHYRCLCLHRLTFCLYLVSIVVCVVSIDWSPPLPPLTRL